MTGTIAIDARWLVGGIGTYTRNILHGLSTNSNGFRVHAITRDQHRSTLDSLCSRLTIVNLPIYSLREQWAIPQAAAGCDLLHVPHYNAPFLHSGPTVITVHDVIHLADPDYRGSYRSRLYARPVMRHVCRKSRHIITVSEYSKVQIIEQLGVPAEKITAIPNGVSEHFYPGERSIAQARVRAELAIDRPYILYVGSLKGYKNITTLLRSFARLRGRRDIPHNLVLVGNDRNRQSFVSGEAEELGIEDRVLFRFDVSEDLLAAVYSAADTFIMPSRVEGFGLPVLEAMACGAPVLCSNAASLPEVGGAAVCYFDPTDTEQLTEELNRLLDSPSLCQDLRRRGLMRARQFTWQASAEAHIQVYSRSIAQN